MLHRRYPRHACGDCSPSQGESRTSLQFSFMLAFPIPFKSLPLTLGAEMGAFFVHSVSGCSNRFLSLLVDFPGKVGLGTRWGTSFRWRSGTSTRACSPCLLTHPARVRCKCYFSWHIHSAAPLLQHEHLCLANGELSASPPPRRRSKISASSTLPQGFERLLSVRVEDRKYDGTFDTSRSLCPFEASCAHPNRAK